MSIWGAHFSENDDAADWLNDFLESPSLLLLNDVFDEIFNAESDAYIDVTDGANALIAASVFIEILNPPPGNRIVQNVEDFDNLKKSLTKMDKSAVRNMLKRATKIVHIVANLEERSELRELMDEDRDLLQKWLNNTTMLFDNLTKQLNTI
jgi:Domain of unknown function (DUF4259)